MARQLTESEMNVATVLAAAATGRKTVAELEHILSEGMRRVDAVGYKNVSTDELAKLAAIEAALVRIKREMPKHTGQER